MVKFQGTTESPILGYRLGQEDVFSVEEYVDATPLWVEIMGTGILLRYSNYELLGDDMPLYIPRDMVKTFWQAIPNQVKFSIIRLLSLEEILRLEEMRG